MFFRTKLKGRERIIFFQGRLFNKAKRKSEKFFSLLTEMAENPPGIFSPPKIVLDVNSQFHYERNPVRYRNKRLSSEARSVIRISTVKKKKKKKKTKKKKRACESSKVQEYNLIKCYLTPSLKAANRMQIATMMYISIIHVYQRGMKMFLSNG